MFPLKVRFWTAQGPTVCGVDEFDIIIDVNDIYDPSCKSMQKIDSPYCVCTL